VSAVLLDDVVRFVRRFVAMSPAQADAAALWVLHTHALDAAEQSPYLAVTSAEKRSGKSRLLDVLELIVARPWRVVTPSEAVIFRKLDAQRSTLLLDECDAIFHDKSNGATEGLRALLNAGNRPGTRVPRCVGPSQTLTDFSVFSAKALAGIRDLPDTVTDRSITIRLKRRSPVELVERFRRREVAPEGEMLRDRIADWLEPQLEELAAARPQLPDELDDRQQDCWEPLFALAEFIGDACLVRARTAALALDAIRDDNSAGVRLLDDIAAIFEALRQGPNLLGRAGN
jgi:hypothetical protein